MPYLSKKRYQNRMYNNECAWYFYTSHLSALGSWHLAIITTSSSQIKQKKNGSVSIDQVLFKCKNNWHKSSNGQTIKWSCANEQIRRKSNEIKCSFPLCGCVVSFRGPLHSFNYPFYTKSNYFTWSHWYNVFCFPFLWLDW